MRRRELVRASVVAVAAFCGGLVVGVTWGSRIEPPIAPGRAGALLTADRGSEPDSISGTTQDASRGRPRGMASDAPSGAPEDSSGESGGRLTNSDRVEKIEAPDSPATGIRPHGARPSTDRLAGWPYEFLPTDSDFAEIVNHLESETAADVDRAVLLLERVLADNPRSLSRLLERLDALSDGAFSRIQMLVVRAGSGDPGLRAQLVALARSAPTAVGRQRGLTVVAFSGWPESLDVFLEVLAPGVPDETRSHAIRAVGACRGLYRMDFEVPLIRASEPTERTDIRLAAISALAQLPALNERTVERLLEVANDRREGMAFRLAALHAIGRHGVGVIAARLEREFDGEPDPHVRQAAVQAAYAIRGRGSR